MHLVYYLYTILVLYIFFILPSLLTGVPGVGLDHIINKLKHSYSILHILMQQRGSGKAIFIFKR